MALPEALQGLLNANAYPHECNRIELVETHISWLLLTGAYAYKVKKPVVFSFLDFSTLELREHYCREELRCNRAFAPALYEDVVPIWRRENGSVQMGGKADGNQAPLEWAVKMRQFEQNAQLDRLLGRGGLTRAMLAAFGRELAARHAALPRLQNTADALDRSVLKPVRDNFAEILPTQLGDRHAALVRRVRADTERLTEQLSGLFEDRLKTGFLRECHGDLHLSNLVLIDNHVTAFDCLEFNADLRWIDTISDVAFLFMDCAERERRDLAYAFLDQYLDASGDYRGAQLLAYFAAYRSVVRAKVAALRYEQDATDETATRFTTHMAWARDWLERRPGMLILMCGLSGAGKSYVAERLVPLLPALRLRSDIARKMVAGLGADARTGSGVAEGLYSPASSDAAFASLAQLTEDLLRTGENVIVDATFIERARRETFLALAASIGTQAHVVWCQAPVELLRERITQREAANRDPSEATVDVLDYQLTRFEEPGAAEPLISIATDAAIDTAALRELVRQLAPT